MTALQTDEQGRVDPPLTAGEVESLLAFLDYQRSTLAWKCRGLDDAQLRAGLPSTALTLGGLLLHLTRIEDNWFSEVVGERDPLEPWDTTEWAAEWRSAAEHTGDELRALWEASVERSRRVVAAQLDARGLDGTYSAWGGQGAPSLRWVLLHMIEEYARHNGHADLLRESVDGETGE